MTYDFIAIPDQDVPQAKDPLFQHLVSTYANKTASMRRAVPDDLLDFKPHEKVNTIRAIQVHPEPITPMCNRKVASADSKTIRRGDPSICVSDSLATRDSPIHFLLRCSASSNALSLYQSG